jgi:isocitrate dehydrogenase
MKKLKLAVLPGDGIGQEVTLSAILIFEVLNIPIELIIGDIGWEFWKTEGNSIPTRTWELINSVDATLLGATTSKPEREAFKELPEKLRNNPPAYVSPIVQLRQTLDLYANVRPCFNIKGEGDNFNFSVIRENTEGLYAGLDFYPLTDDISNVLDTSHKWNHLSKTDAACTIRLQTKAGLTRLFEFAFSYAEREKFDRVTFADKPNVLRKSSAFARDVFETVAQQYPGIKADIHNVDAVALWMVKRPQEFGVIVAENMFGDILSDLGAGVMGGLGFAASANIGIKGAYFEPVHGSAPRVKPNLANPGAMFLTIGLLLEHFGYDVESKQIKQAVKQVVKDGIHVTYDLGGNASTQEMAKAIIDRFISPKDSKKISFLATGNEIIQGDLQDSNSNFFAKSITANGGSIYQHIQSSDNKLEIISSLKYLLSKSDAVILTGGLGPTSDDMTRFAVAEIIKSELIFSDSSWAHVVSRLERFNLPVTDSNRQQALFPKQAELYPNENGTAFGCHILWQNKHLFMLPGPPKECRPMFEKHILATLENANFFHMKKNYRWLTLGLIEGEIAPQIDHAAKSSLVETAYRWNYPYLEIKLICDDQEDIQKVVTAVNDILSPFIVSTEHETSLEVLHSNLLSFSETLHIIDEVTQGDLQQELNSLNLKFVKDKSEKVPREPLFLVRSLCSLQNQTTFSGKITLQCEGYVKDKLTYEHTILIPNRGAAEVIDYAKCYITWQISQFINFCRI